MVRNMRAVLKKASWGTRRIFGSIRCKKQASTVRMRYSVPKTASSGTRRIFKGPQNNRLHRLWTAYCPPDAFSEACRAKSSTCRTGPHLQCAKRPQLSLFAPAPSTISFVPLTRNLSPAAPSLAPSTALGTRNDPRSEVSRHKKGAPQKERTSIKLYDLIISPEIWLPAQLQDVR